MSLPELSTTGSYRLFGTIPPSLDLGTSQGKERFQGEDAELDITMQLGTRCIMDKLTDITMR